MDEKKVIILKKSEVELFFKSHLHLKPSKDAPKEWNLPSHTAPTKAAQKTSTPLYFGIRP